MGKSIMNREKFTCLFSIYEKGLINYHQVFQDANYNLEFIVRRKRLSREFQIQIVLTIIKNPLWRMIFNEPRNIQQLIKDYSAYFSITDVRILRPLKRYKINEELTFVRKPIEERIYFEYYSELSTSDFEIRELI